MAAHSNHSSATAPNGRVSLVDSAEQALRSWLAPGGHRKGDRLPPEHELASMLGVSRGTLRTALQRLETSGEIVRRQGSGTFVGRVAHPAALHEGLERLESYSSLARSRGVELGVRDLRIERSPLGPELARLLGADPGTPAVTLSRILLADGEPAALMVDTVHPDMPLPDDAGMRRAMERGDMVLDVLTGQAVPIAFATTRIFPRLLAVRERAAKALGVTRATAVLELQETFHRATGETTHHSSDLFAPAGLDLRVVRFVAAAPLPQVGGDQAASERARRSGR